MTLIDKIVHYRFLLLLGSVFKLVYFSSEVEKKWHYSVQYPSWSFWPICKLVFFEKIPHILSLKKKYVKRPGSYYLVSTWNSSMVWLLSMPQNLYYSHYKGKSAKSQPRLKIYLVEKLPPPTFPLMPENCSTPGHSLLLCQIDLWHPVSKTPILLL